MQKSVHSHVVSTPAEGLAPAPKSMRQSNMELLRLLSMLFVLMLHANYFSISAPSQADLLASPLPAATRVLFEHLSIVAVNVFVLISGWFGIKPRWKGFANFLFQVLFLSLAVTVCFLAAGQAGMADVLKNFYVGSGYWFVVAYIGLYMFSPLLNKFVEHSTRRGLGLFLVAYFTMEFFYGFVVDYAPFKGGYSMLSFIGLYLLARYLRLYPVRWQARSGKFFLSLYFMTMVTNALLFLVSVYCGHSLGRLIDYNSPLVILGSVFLLLAFSRLRLQSRIINRAAASCFAIYLIHSHPLVAHYYKEWFKWLFNAFSGVPYLLLVLVCLLAIGMACILVDQVRIVCWKRFLPLLERVACHFSA